MKTTHDASHRIEFFGKIAACYDFLVDLITLGQYVRLLKKAIGILSPQPGEKILELCSGTGRASAWMAQAVGETGEIVGFDLAPSMVRVATKRFENVRNLNFHLQDVTKAWSIQNRFDGVFIAFSLHELPESTQEGVIRQSFLALKDRGRLVILDFNPELSGPRKDFLVLFFRLFEGGNLSYLFFKEREVLKGAGFSKVTFFPMFFGLLRITLARKG